MLRLSKEREKMLSVKFYSLFIISIFCLPIQITSAQSRTDPKEAKAINTILGRWGKPASPAWNISGDPCTGAAVDLTDFDKTAINPIIKCDCVANTNTTCHITKLKVYALNVVGIIPEELQDLPFLTNLNIGQNYLTGPFPAFMGNLTSMQYLSLGINALSGTIPAELGNLRNLVVLGMGTNSFSGPLPSEFGNLNNLEQLYMDSCGLSGELPSNLSKLKKMKTLWAADNNFTGKIPDYLGSWSNLTSLRFQGNSFVGPIPASLSKLVGMTDLRIGDIVNGTSSLVFISKMTSLSILILRNAKISDKIPSDFSQYNSLMKLDLSFNNITGTLPQSLFNLSTLAYLFLGNNSLSGNLPTLKSSSIANLDLSYNQLSGSFPSWVSDKKLELNLIANNFNIDDSSSSVLPSGLKCLQRNIPCNRGSPIYSNFAVKCGGNKVITDSSGIAYDVDNANLSTASYYVNDQNKWGVSSVGNFAEDTTGANYIITSSAQFLNTLDSELFQTARMSPSSLRYFGLGLENGNYSIELQFSEIAFPDSPTWQSTGRRVFDILIQGNLAEKDFNIEKAAGGKPLRAVVKKYVAPVTNNFLEIHFFWAGKGTCCVPTQGYYGPSISAISVSPYDFTPTVSNRPSNSKSKNTGVIVGVVVAIGILGFLAGLGFFIFKQKQRKRRLSEEDEEELAGMANRPDTFSYAELKNATNDFNICNLLGEGGFGAVHKGKLYDGRIIAVKQLTVANTHGKRQFMAEIGTISAVQHRNLVKLYGCCIEGDKRLVVYEYLENKSLDQALFGKSGIFLDWPTRFDICLGAARGLAYLHEESSIRIVHRDVKASNILLDTYLNPKISDFGLAKLYDDKKTHITTRVAGTIGYLAPEYAMRGHLTEKADVFGFGVVVLEVLSGRPNADTTLEEEKVYLLEWAWRLHEGQRALDLLDPKLSSFDEKQANRLIGVALLCTQASPMLRPHMSRVIAMLSGDIEVPEVTTKPSYLTEYHLKDLTSDYMSCDFSKASDDSSKASGSTSTYSQISGDTFSPAQPLTRADIGGR